MNTAPAASRVRRAGPSDVAAVTALVVDALSRDPVAQWLVPDPAERPDVLHRLLAVEVDHAVETGYVYVSVDWSAAAVWQRHDLNAQRWALGDYHLTTFAGRAVPRFDDLNAATRSYRPNAPHHWLSWLAVQPDYGWHVAGDLLRAHHQVIDQTGDPAYAVVTTDGARHLLRANGYREDLPLHLPSGPRLWPLRRSGRPTPRNP
ncbi:hypothetical protein [Micromonospora sp. NPDC050495]|uniref:hypothetical protein n=1 Tax=Micromonospora sp. NPDC050495 TaxID=3154936 RepID=UPI0033D57497